MMMMMGVLNEEYQPRNIDISIRSLISYRLKLMRATCVYPTSKQTVICDIEVTKNGCWRLAVSFGITTALPIDESQ